MVHLRNGTPEHRAEYHLLLSVLIPFDQNNCHLHRYHRFCHLHRRHCHSPSHQGFFGFGRGKGEVVAGAAGDGGGSLDQIKCESFGLREEKKKSLIALPYSNHHIHCLNATDILSVCLDILNLTSPPRTAHLGRAGA